MGGHNSSNADIDNANDATMSMMLNTANRNYSNSQSNEQQFRIASEQYDKARNEQEITNSKFLQFLNLKQNYGGDTSIGAADASLAQAVSSVFGDYGSNAYNNTRSGKRAYPSRVVPYVTPSRQNKMNRDWDNNRGIISAAPDFDHSSERQLSKHQIYRMGGGRRADDIASISSQGAALRKKNRGIHPIHSLESPPPPYMSRIEFERSQARTRGYDKLFPGFTPAPQAPPSYESSVVNYNKYKRSTTFPDMRIKPYMRLGTHQRVDETLKQKRQSRAYMEASDPNSTWAHTQQAVDRAESQHRMISKPSYIESSYDTLKNLGRKRRRGNEGEDERRSDNSLSSRQKRIILPSSA